MKKRRQLLIAVTLMISCLTLIMPSASAQGEAKAVRVGETSLRKKTDPASYDWAAEIRNSGAEAVVVRVSAVLVGRDGEVILEDPEVLTIEVPPRSETWARHDWSPIDLRVAGRIAQVRFQPEILEG